MVIDHERYPDNNMLDRTDVSFVLFSVFSIFFSFFVVPFFIYYYCCFATHNSDLFCLLCPFFIFSSRFVIPIVSVDSKPIIK
jgi:hypothetical protein